MFERSDVPRRLACFLAQQAVGKSIKAALIYLQKEFPFRYALDLLRDLLPDDWALKETPTDLGALSAWAVRGRYPGDLPEATREDAKAAIEKARKIYETALEDLEEHGYDKRDGEPREEPSQEENA